MSEPSQQTKTKNSQGKSTVTEPSPTAAAEPKSAQLPPDRYLDRELSWLGFNERVLELAADPGLQLLERASFLAIFANNLDEFFMVRVAGLKRRVALGIAVPAVSGYAPLELLSAISKEAHRLQERQSSILHEHVLPELEKVGIGISHFDDLDQADRARLRTYFDEKVFPILTPLAVDSAHPFPYISGLSLNLAVIVRNPTTNKREFARVKVPQSLPRFIRVGEIGDAQTHFVPLEELISAHLDQLFPGMEVVESHAFRVTRNEDLEVDEDEAENLLQALEKELLRRRFGPPVRLEVASDINPTILELLVSELGVQNEDVYKLREPLDLTGLFAISGLNRPELHYPVAVPVTNRFLQDIEPHQHTEFFGAIRKQDILLHHPYESFATSVQAFLEHAAADPTVLAIKQTLYRTSGDSPIVQALIDAADAGKQVLALVEIKARFDEANNISWARKLERAGVHVVYGLVGLKTHCKLSLAVREEEGRLVRYSHVGTGNYNPKTARLYEDLGLLTASEEVGADLGRLFNHLSGYSAESDYNRLLVAPKTIRTGLIDLVDQEIAHARAGKTSGIKIKVNSLVDEQIIDSLYRASQAGVPVEVWVRGICALKPGEPGLSENITVRSVLGRFLEHSRIFWFANEGDPIVYIGSADMMHRNLDRRVEALVRLVDPDQISELTDLLAMGVADTTSSWHLSADGSWKRHYLDDHGNRLLDVQEELLRIAATRKARARAKRK
ncbi:RNA degradosome polyphosphate kinase [Pseudoclavibacter sp. CFCC 13611]|uniref:RNA degradosome polyphosphate kinase n=1 Tax=Pseudoclavibacter sp. CFCC 13611 TaxID=2615178 RepID=UPI0013012D51|nr:RNA degradosome polyphosphate kinase [Pseudoclavibacter sp. CFCC 13611]KAB1662744.1 RNA degradosome polyphosphate kinase [Pseudoclavibacter sp. CFCC 13611]